MHAQISLDRGGTDVATSLAVTKPKLPRYLFLRGDIIWYRLPNEAGKWVSKTTKYRYPDQLDAAERMLKTMLRGLKAQRERAERSEVSGRTLRAYVETWLKDREARGIACAAADRQRLEDYVLPILGDLLVEEVRPRHVRDLIRKLEARKGAEKRSARTIIHIYNVLHNVYESAVIEEIVVSNPVKVMAGELPKKVDADPEWRSQAMYTVREVERLISDSLIPVERRVQYALKALAGLRHGEIAALCWRHLDYTAEPLARINVVQAYSTTERTVKSTKTEETRAVPMHPTLAKILASWKVEHWERIYGRAPTDDDFVVPTRTFACVDGADACHAMKDDLDALKLRKEAGKRRTRGGHDMRSWYKTRLIEDGADSLIIRRTTHAPPKDVDGGYNRFSWAAICREVSKLKVEVLDGKVLELVTASSHAEAKARARWQNRVTPKGLEASKRAPSNGQAIALSSGDTSEAPSMSAHSRTDRNGRSLQSILRTAGAMLERALLAGDTPRALRIAAELREMDATNAVEAKRAAR